MVSMQPGEEDNSVAGAAWIGVQPELFFGSLSNYLPWRPSIPIPGLVEQHGSLHFIDLFGASVNQMWSRWHC